MGRGDVSQLLSDRSLSRLVLDERVHHDLVEVGVSVAGPFLSPDDLERLRGIHQRLERELDGIGGPWFTTGMLSDRQLRRQVFDEVGAVMLPRLRPLLTDSAHPMSGNLHVNPVHPDGGLGPHQDIALVDERTSSTLNGWVGLQDATAENGALRFVPASHRFGNVDRSLAAPWPYEGLHDLFWEHSIRIEVPAGHLVLFDTAMVHCSTPNSTETPRVAANCVIRERTQPLQHLVARGDEVLVYEIEESFLIEGDVTGTPRSDEGRCLGQRPRLVPVNAPDDVEQMCREGMRRVR